MSYHRIISYTWLAVMIVWLLAAFMNKRTVRIYRGVARVFQFVLLVPAFFIIFDSDLAVGFLGWRVLPPTASFQIIGLALTLAGLGFALWARFFLGRNWSGEITVKEDHQLIRTGPYAIVRHPIYSGFLLGLLGTAVALGQVRDFIGLVLAAIGWRLKSRVEERFMTQQFGDEYTSYKSEVKALLPFIW